MDWIDYLRALRRRWKIVTIAVVIALITAWFTTTATSVLGSPATLYRATTVMLNTGTLDSLGVSNLETAAALVTVGDVPKRVRAALKTPESAASLATTVTATVDTKTGVLKIEAVSPEQARAETLADAFAAQLISFLADRKAQSIATQADALTKRLAELRSEISVADRRVASTSGPAQSLAATERDAKIRQYGFTYEFYQRLTERAAEPGQLQVIQQAEALPVAQGGFAAPRSRSSRLALGGVLGLIAGAAIALLLERVDTRIRTKQEAEEGFALPVLAEIPIFARPGRGTIETVTHPSSAASHCFRLLRGGITQESRLRTGWNGEEGRFSGTILVTSGAPADGKTTVVANLAPVFAELGLSVLILSCDFRRPDVHRYYRVPNDRGLVDAIRSADGWRLLEGISHRTGIRDVRLVPSGPVPQNPGELMSSDWMRQVLKEARRSADVVLLDTAPILAASDATHLLPQVDGVLVVCRAGRATTELAQRTTEMLQRLGAHTLGLVLNGADASSVLARGYYEYAGDRPSGRFGRIMQRVRVLRPRMDAAAESIAIAHAAREAQHSARPKNS